MTKCAANTCMQDNSGLPWTAAGIASSILLCGLSVGALGATNSVVDCQEYGNGIAESSSAFIVSLVDLQQKSAELGLAEPMDASESSADSSAPFLYLTPRVATMLREIFAEDARDGVTDRKSLLPPVARGSDDNPPLTNLQKANPGDGPDGKLRFRPRMYRTDI